MHGDSGAAFPGGQSVLCPLQPCGIMLATLASVPLPELLVHLLKPSQEALGAEDFPKGGWSDVLLAQHH